MQTDEIVIPLGKVDPEFVSPRSIVILARPKIGKTTLVAELPNSLILDFEKGTSFIPARKIEIEHYGDINKIHKSLKVQNIELDYVVIDTVTSMCDHALLLAEKLYSESSIGKNWFEKYKAEYHSILNLPKGAGYYWLRIAFMKILNKIKMFAPRVVIVAHTKDETLLSGSTEVQVTDIDLPGQLKRLLSESVDAIGYITRKKNQNIISFKSKDGVTCGTRQQHIRNSEFVISEFDEDGNLITYWDKIFID